MLGGWYRWLLWEASLVEIGSDCSYLILACKGLGCKEVNVKLEVFEVPSFESCSNWFLFVHVPAC